MKNNFSNTIRMVHFIIRRERVTSTLWIMTLSLFSIVLAPMLANMFDTQAREALIETVNNPAMIGILGPIYGIENYTPGAMYFNMVVQWVMIAAAVMNILLIVRYTRNDEERGRSDMLLSLPVGRLSNLAAVILMAIIVNLLVMLITGFGITAMGVNSMDLKGSLLYSASIGAVGLFFAALTAVFSQLCTTSRGATGLSFLSLGFLYLLRGAGDVGREILSLISPLGLAQRTQAYVENHWLPIFILLAEVIIITLIAFILNSYRDIRQGFIPEKPGRESAHLYLRSPYGLAFRLLLIPFFGWIFAMYVMGAAYGSILGRIDTFVQSSEVYSMIIGARPEFSTAQMFVSMVTSLMALFAVVPVLMIVLKLRSEEKDGYFQNVLSHAVSRQTYMASYVIIAILTSVLVQCATALGIYSASIMVLPDSSILTLSYLLKANLVFLPALWVMLGFAVLLIGLFKDIIAIVWVYFGFLFFVTFIGRLPVLFPDWLSKLTPFGYIPNLPVDEINYGTLIIMSVIAIVMIFTGFIAYRRRDIASS